PPPSLHDALPLAFTPSALPDFSAIPASIPSHPSFVSPPFHSWSVILGQVQIFLAKNVSGRLVRPCSPLLLDAVCDPGAGVSRSSPNATPSFCLRLKP